MIVFDGHNDREWLCVWNQLRRDNKMNLKVGVSGTRAGNLKWKENRCQNREVRKMGGRVTNYKAPLIGHHRFVSVTKKNTWRRTCH